MSKITGTIKVKQNPHMLQYVDQSVRIGLKDTNKILIGTFKSFDKYMNVILHDCEEIRYIKPRKGGIDKERRKLGFVFLRGESIVYLGKNDPRADVVVTPDPDLMPVLHYDREMCVAKVLIRIRESPPEDPPPLPSNAEISSSPREPAVADGRAKMMDYLNMRVRVGLTNSKKTYEGVFQAFDRNMNVILADCEEWRNIRPRKGGVNRERRDLGMVLLPGDNVSYVAVLGPSSSKPSETNAFAPSSGEPEAAPEAPSGSGERIATAADDDVFVGGPIPQLAGPTCGFRVPLWGARGPSPRMPIFGPPRMRPMIGFGHATPIGFGNTWMGPTSMIRARGPPFHLPRAMMRGGPPPPRPPHVNSPEFYLDSF